MPFPIRRLTPEVLQHLAHLVLAVSVRYSALLLRLKLVVDRDVQVSPVPVVRSACQLARYILASLYGEDIGKVEDSLLPVRVLGVWASAESDGLVAGGELDIEPCDEGVNIVCSAY